MADAALGRIHHGHGHRCSRQGAQRPAACFSREFYRAEPGKWMKNDVLVNFGRPEETAYFSLIKREVWSYRYLEDHLWYRLFHFYFDDTGVLSVTRFELHDSGDAFQRCNN